MNKKYPTMFSPITIGKPGVIFKNRIWTAPTGVHLLAAGEPYPNEAVIAHYREKARGGAACICFSAQNMNLVGLEEPDPIHADPNIFEERYHNYWYRLTSAVHFFGAKISLELLAFIRQDRDENGEEYMWSVNGEYDDEMEMELPAMPLWAMEKMAADYAQAAKHAVKVGFDMIMLHFGHGTFVANFLSPKYNQRTDEFGGSAENRARFPIMIIDAIREAIGPRVPIEVRLSADECVEGGGTVADCVDFLRRIEDKVDLAHISCGTVQEDVTQTKMHPVEFYQPGCNAHYAREVKEAGIKIPVLTLGAFQKPELIEETLATGGADVVAMARGTIADADCINKARDGREDEIIPCLKCFFCLSYDMEMEFGCAANPKVGREYILDQFIPAQTTPKRVGIIGGGPAGMAGAIFAAQRGHDVTLYEKASELGGKIVFAQHADFKYALNDTLTYQRNMVKKLGVRVVLNCEATPEMIAAENFDVVFAAVGSDPVIIPIPGHDMPHVMTAEPCFGNLDKVGERVVVIGGGEVGCETALYLARGGKKVSIIEMLPELAAASAYAPQLAIQDIVPKECEVHVNARSSFITEHSVGYVDLTDNSEHEIECDTVVFSAGMRSRTALAESFRDCAPIFFKLGDCEQAKNVRVCNRTAFDAAMQI